MVTIYESEGGKRVVYDHADSMESARGLLSDTFGNILFEEAIWETPGRRDRIVKIEARDLSSGREFEIEEGGE